MKNLLLLILSLPIFLTMSCTEEESCADTEVVPVVPDIRVNINIVNRDGNKIPSYPVRSRIQKSFCDGDVGLPVDESGTTDGVEGKLPGSFWGKWWSIPYVNEKDYITVYFYAGPDDKYGDKEVYNYRTAKNNDFFVADYTFIVDP